MRTIYIDDNFKCYAENGEGRRAIQTDLLDNICDIALECYIFVPKNSEWKGKKLNHDFVQCVDSKSEQLIQRQYRIDDNNSTQIQAELMNDIEELCNELIG